VWRLQRARSKNHIHVGDVDVDVAWNSWPALHCIRKRYDSIVNSNLSVSDLTFAPRDHPQRLSTKHSDQEIDGVLSTVHREVPSNRGIAIWFEWP